MSAGEHITRRILPHWYVPGAVHFVTYRLAGTLPAEVMHRLRDEKESRARRPLPHGLSLAEFRERLHKRFFAAYDDYLDQTCTVDWLTHPPVAAMLRQNLYHHSRRKYHLIAYCIMPNHVHVLIQPTVAGEIGTTTGDETPDAQGPLAAIMHSLKSYTANEANRLLGRSGQFWQHESYDHWVRNEDELERIVDYIAANPVKAKLVRQPHEWLFCSAHDRFLHDGSISAWLPTES